MCVHLRLNHTWGYFRPRESLLVEDYKVRSYIFYFVHIESLICINMRLTEMNLDSKLNTESSTIFNTWNESADIFCFYTTENSIHYCTIICIASTGDWTIPKNTCHNSNSFCYLHLSMFLGFFNLVVCLKTRLR